MKGAPRVLENGDIFFPVRGRPPLDIAGYERDSRDPFLFHPAAGTCSWRGKITSYRLCGSTKVKYDCEKLGLIVLEKCLTCPLREPE